MDKFEKLTTDAAVETDAVETEGKAAKKSQFSKEQVNAFKEKLASDPELQKELRRYSDHLEVVNTLGYSDGGSIVEDKSSPDGKRALVKTPAIVGYVIRNNGDETLTFANAHCTQDENGVWQEAQVDTTLAPGATAIVPKKYLTMLASQPMFSFQLANGYMKRSSRGNTGDMNPVDAELSKWYFASNDDAIKVNDDAFKKNISREIVDSDGTRRYEVLPEYTEWFGTLNNTVTKERKARAKATGTQFSNKDLAADYIQTLLKSQGL